MISQNMIFNAAALMRLCPLRGKTLLWAAIVRNFSSYFNGMVPVHFPEGFRMLLDTKDLVQAFMLAGCYERRTAYYLKRLLEPGDCFIDGGAYIGFYSCLAASRVGSSGAVYSFEPNPNIISSLNKQLALNPQLAVKVLQTALGSSSAPMRFFTPPSQWHSQALASHDTKNLYTPEWAEIHVPCVTLDQFIQSEKISKVTLCKLDLERGEPDALRGSRESLRSGALESLIVEATAETIDDIVTELAPYSFEVIQDLRFHQRCRTIQDLRKEKIGSTYATNLLFARGKAALRWRRLGIIQWFV